MTTSNTIALIVATILVLVCSLLLLNILIRGRFEASGYTITWKTSPVGMVVTLLSVLACPVLIIWGATTQWSRRTDECLEPYRVYVAFEPGNMPEFRYERPGVRRKLVVTKEDDDTFRFSFSAMSLPAGVAWELDGVNDLPEYRIFDFSGILSCANGFNKMDGELQSRGRGQLVVGGARNEVSLSPGKNHIAVAWSHSQP